MIAKYENEREMRQRQLEEKRMERQRQEQDKMRRFLAQQVAEKKQREHDEKSNIDVQASMWQTDKRNWEEEEKRLKSRIDKINRDNQEYLVKQMGLKDKENRKMHPQEFALNRPLLREINQKLKQSNYQDSQNGEAR